jgi:hypothetical protein
MEFTPNSKIQPEILHNKFPKPNLHVTITQKFCSMRLSEYSLQESKLPKEQSSPNLDFKSSEINTQKSTYSVLKTPKINIHSILLQKIQKKIPNRLHLQQTQKLTQKKKINPTNMKSPNCLVPIRFFPKNFGTL